MSPTTTTTAFVIRPNVLPRASRTHNTHRCRPSMRAPSNSSNAKEDAVTAAPSSPSVSRHVRAKGRARARAPVIDSRVAGVVEAHHWIVVASGSTRAFEKAALANAHVTSLVEKRSGNGALHRWLLTLIPDPTLGFMDGVFRTETTTYVVMETFKSSNLDERLTQRWLSAVKRVRPMFEMLDIRSLSYENVFTSKVHGASFDPNCNVVVVESVNVDMSRPQNLQEVMEILRTGAEASVSAGECLEFCVLQAKDRPGFFKTIEVYKDVDALRAHMDGFDRAFVRRTQGRTIGSHRSRQTFKPVFFA